MSEAIAKGVKGRPDMTPLTPDQWKLVESCLAGCRLVARENTPVGYRRDPQAVEDSHDAAFDALVRAARRFKPELGYQFTTYAWHGMRRAVWSHWKRGTRTLMHPAGRQSPGTFLDEWHQLSEGVEDHRVTDPAGLSDEALAEATARAEEVREARELVNALYRVDARAANLLKARFLEGKSLAELGREHGISRERVRQIQNAGLEKIWEMAVPA